MGDAAGKAPAAVASAVAAAAAATAAAVALSGAAPPPPPPGAGERVSAGAAIATTQGPAFFSAVAAGAAGPGSDAGAAVAMVEALDAATEHLSELGLHAQALAAVHEGRRLQAEAKFNGIKASVGKAAGAGADTGDASNQGMW